MYIFVKNTKTEKLVQTQYMRSHLFLGNIINSVCGWGPPCSAPFDLLGGRTSVALHRTVVADIIRKSGVVSGDQGSELSLTFIQKVRV